MNVGSKFDCQSGLFYEYFLFLCKVQFGECWKMPHMKPARGCMCRSNNVHQNAQKNPKAAREAALFALQPPTLD
jgi:hypothetical protein